MSSIVTSILSSTVGLLWNKVRDTTAKHLGPVVQSGFGVDSRLKFSTVCVFQFIK